MKIHRILNNNVVIILDHKNNQESIVCGKGIAFKKKSGDEIDEKLINKVFVLKDEKMNDRFKQLLSDIPLEFIDFSDEMIRMAERKLNRNLGDSLIVSLSDHIFTVGERVKEGIVIHNAMLWEIKRFYPQEYNVGLEVISEMKKKFHIDLPEDEAAFIALHIINSSVDKGLEMQTLDTIKIMQEISNIVKYYFNVEFDSESVYYYRFVTHLKFFVRRLLCHQTLNEDGKNELFEKLRLEYTKSAECIEKVAKFLDKKYQYKLSDEEKLYLMIHIERVVSKSTL